MDELLKTITGFLANNRINLTNLVLSGITAGLNVLLEEELFDCPKEDFRTYGYMFLFAPFIIFLLVNMMAIVTVWDLTKITPVIPTIPRVFVAPILWLIVSFAESSYYVCAKVGRKPTNESEKEAEDFENMMAKSKTESQYIAWGLFIGMVAVIFLVNICYGKSKMFSVTTTTILWTIPWV